MAPIRQVFSGAEEIKHVVKRKAPRLVSRAAWNTKKGDGFTWQPSYVTRSQRSIGSGTVVREVLSSADRKKIDEVEDTSFYSSPRFVKHVDDAFLAAVTRLYGEFVPGNGEVLDLMSSWVSHLPKHMKFKRVVGHGMNAAEYLQEPEQVFAEIFRVLKPGGICIVTFSNRLYFSKAVKAWRDCPNDYGRLQLVKQYFMCVDGFTLPEARKELQEPRSQPGWRGLLEKARGLFQKGEGDPFYAVFAYKGHKPGREAAKQE